MNQFSNSISLKTIFFLALTIGALLTSCEKDDECEEVLWYQDADNDGLGDPDVSQEACTQPTGFVADSTDPDDGTLGFATTGGGIVVNEGGFQLNNGSITFISSTGEVSNNVFATANNGLSLGDVVQSYSKIGNTGIIAVNNSQKVEIVNAQTFVSIATVTQNLDYPRFALGISESKAYVSNGSGDGTIVVINLNDYTVSKVIPMGQGPEVMLKSGENVFVANSGGFGTDSTVSIVNSSTDTETEKVVVGDIPIDLEEDANGDIWVLCRGVSNFDNWPDIKKTTASKLVRINVSTNIVDKEIVLIAKEEIGDVSRLTISKDGQTLYYLKDSDIYKVDISAATAPSQPFIPGDFYGLDMNPLTDELWATTNGFDANQQVKVYDNTGSRITTYETGIGTSSSVFNR